MRKILMLLLLFSLMVSYPLFIQAKERTNSEKGRVNMENLNKNISNVFDEAFVNMNTDNLSALVDKLLPPIQENKTSINAKLDNSSKIATLQGKDVSITVNDRSRFHIFLDGERLTLDDTDVPETRWSNWKNEDRSIGEIRDIIFGGRSLDPYPQLSWNDKEIINSNWPDLKTTLGPVKLDFNSSGNSKAIFVKPNSSQIGATYGIIPRGTIMINQDSSITMAFQIENTCKTIDNKTGKPYIWAPWTILPLKLSEKGAANNPDELVAFPGKLSQKAGKKWSKVKIDNTDFVILNPYVFDTKEAEKTFYPDTNWSVIARKGSDKVILMRTVYNHTDQFQVYNGQPEYVELEATAPLVPPGGKSTVITKLDFISLSKLDGINFKRFGETGNLNAEISAVLKLLSKK